METFRNQGGDIALKTGLAPPSTALYPCLLTGRGDNAKFPQFLQYMKDWLWTERLEILKNFGGLCAEDDD